MKPTTLILLLALVLTAGNSFAQSTHEFSFSPSFGLWQGETKYELDLDFGKSELVFPLGVPMVGAKISWREMHQGQERWFANARLATSLGDPGGVFTDKDWVKTDFMGLFLISSTESNVEGSVVDLEVELGHRLFGDEKFDFNIVAGLGYQKIEQDAIDLSGTVNYVTDSSIEVYHVEYDSLALTYEVKYLRPFIGVMPKVRVSEGLTVALRGTVSPFIYAEDLDDHVLRDFTSQVDGNGFGVTGRLGLDYQSRKSSGLRPLFGLETELRYASIDAKGARLYYEDNLTDGFDAGEGYAEERKIKTTQYGARIYFGLFF